MYLYRKAYSFSPSLISMSMISFFNLFRIRRWVLIGACSISFLTQAQTGPGGVGNSSTNKVWLDASYQIPYSNGTSQVLILDRSGNGWDAQQFNGGNYRPTFLNNA